MRAKDYKERALAHLKDNWGYGILVSFIFMAILGIGAGGSAGVLVLLFESALLIGYNQAFVNHALKGEGYKIETLFIGFTDGKLDRNLLLSLLKNIFIFLWSLLFVIPGIIKFYAYKASEYIAYLHPEYSWKECLDKSSELMNGNKGRLFLLHLSFIGWYILAAMTFGIGFIFLIPYVKAAETEFFIDLLGMKKDYDFSK